AGRGRATTTGTSRHSTTSPRAIPESTCWRTDAADPVNAAVGGTRGSRPQRARAQPARIVDLPLEPLVPAPVVVGLVLHRDRAGAVRPRSCGLGAPRAVPGAV